MRRQAELLDELEHVKAAARQLQHEPIPSWAQVPHCRRGFKPRRNW